MMINVTVGSLHFYVPKKAPMGAGKTKIRIYFEFRFQNVRDFSSPPTKPNDVKLLVPGVQ